MKIYCLGDSLTEGDYGIKGKSGIANVQDKNYPFFLSGLLSCEVVNCGKCGYRASNYLKYYLSELDLSDADIVIIMLGSNGGHSADMDYADDIAYGDLIDAVKNDSHAEIVLCTPPHVTIDPSFSNCGYREQVDTAVSFVRKLAEIKSLRLIDTAAFSEFNDRTEKMYQSNDGLHFVEAGYRVLAEFIAGNIRMMFPDLF